MFIHNELLLYKCKIMIYSVEKHKERVKMKIKEYISHIIKIGIVVIVCAFPPLIFYKIDMTTEWMGFWGNYISALVGALITFIISLYTNKQNEKQNNIIIEQNRQIKEQNIISRKSKEEERRIQILPIINVTPGSSSSCSSALIFDTNGKVYKPGSEKMNYGAMTITNIGDGQAFNVRVSHMDIGHFATKLSKSYEIKFPASVSYLRLEITFLDKEKREYEQVLELIASNQNFIVDYIISSPLLIE